jgi:predicted PurR-regulated permease PerM
MPLPDGIVVNRHDLSTRALIKIIVTVAGAWLAVKLWDAIVLIAIALVLVGTLRPIAAWLEGRRVPRVVALGMILAAVVCALVLVGLLTIPALGAQLADIVAKAPALQADLAEKMRHSTFLRPVAASVESFEVGAALGGLGNQLLTWSSHAVIVIGEGVTAFFLALYLLSGREREQGALFALVPRRYHLRLARVLASLERIVGGYVRGQLITSVLIAVFTFGLLTALGVHNAVALAVFAGITDVIPFIGGLVATTPAVLAALSKGVPAALIVFAAMFVYQELESRIIVPRVYGRVLRLSPALVIVALLIGGILMGLLGALLALPVAAGLRTLIDDLRLELPGEADRSAGLLRDDAAAEKEYAERAEAATAVDAAVIARTIEAESREAAAEGSAGASTEPG